MRYLLIFWSLFLAGCVETTLEGFDAAPSVSILSPTDEDIFSPGALVEFFGLVGDDTGVEHLTVTWSSSIDQILGQTDSDAEGNVYLAVADLTGGIHAITLTAQDPGGNQTSSSISIEIGYGGGAEGEPIVAILGPTAGDSYIIDDEIMFVGSATDNEDENDLLNCTLSSNRDGTFWTGNPDTAGTINVPYNELDPGVHTITLTAQDTEGNLATTSVSDIEVVNDGRPYVTITAPLTYSQYWMTDVILFEGSVTDDESDTEVLVYEWRSDQQGVIGSGNPSSVGYVATSATLGAGTHVITLTAIDEDNQVATDTIVLEVRDPNDVDQDGDGYTPNQGDCDDTDPNVSPGEPEICDDLDNNCDGYINEPWADIYEWDNTNQWNPNDSATSVFDLGEVDSLLWANSTISLTGLTLHHANDEDWFYWDAGDDIFFDNVAITINIQTPTSGNYTAVLYQVDGDKSNFTNYSPEDSATGNGILQLNFTGAKWDDDEDDWVLRIYANSWPAMGCSNTFAINITS
jgi:hypothetical protein